MDLPALALPADLRYEGVTRPPLIHDDMPTDEDIVRAVEFNRLVETSRNRADKHRSETSIREAAEATIYKHRVVASRGFPGWEAMMATMGTNLGKTLSDEMKKIVGDEMKRSEERLAIRFGDELKQLREEIKQLREEIKQSDQRLGARFKNELEQFGNKIKADIGRLDTQMTAVQAEVRKVHRLAVQTHIKMTRRDNGYFNDESDLDEVPFADGRFPWDKIVAGPAGTGNVRLPPLSSVQAIINLSHPEVYSYHRGYYPDASSTGSIHSRRKKILAAIGRHDVLPQPTP